MSGFAGILQLDGSPVLQDALEAMTNSLRMRGQGHGRSWMCGPLGFATTTAVSFNGADTDPSVSIIGDFRIDDQANLRRQLGADPAATPQKLLRSAWKAWKERLPERVLGDYSLAIWDAGRKRLFCAVDAFRVRPLYYAILPGAFVFSNTLAAVLAHPALSRRLDEDAIGDLLLFGFYMSAERSIWAGIKRLPRGSCMTVDSAGLQVWRYWTPPRARPEETRSSRHARDEFRELLGRAVVDRLDPAATGIMLSGGLDSTLIAALACGLASPRRIHGHTVVFNRLVADSERGYAEQVGHALGIPVQIHAADDFDPGLSRDALGDAPSPPEPLLAPRWGWTVRFRRLMACQSSTVLTGNDADALLHANLPGHWRGLVAGFQLGALIRDACRHWQIRRRLPSLGARSLFRTNGRVPPHGYPPWINPDFERRTNLRDRWRKYHSPIRSAGARNEARIRLLHPTWDNLFENFDAGWTGVPLEFAHPFMDRRVAEFLLGLPPVPWCVNKELLRQTLAPYVPAAVTRRAKTPLASRPRLERLRELPDWWRRHAAALSPRIEPYIDRSAWKELAAIVNPEPLELNLRPILLSQWLSDCGLTTED